MSGVGDDGANCYSQCDICGALENGELLTYIAFVIDANTPGDRSWHVPALYGLKDMRKANMHVATRKNQFVKVPD